MNKFNHFKQLNKKEKIKLLIITIIIFISSFGLAGMMAWLCIEHNNILDYVKTNFNPETGQYKDEIYKNGKDLFLNKDGLTFGELYSEMGQDGFAWFWLTNYKIVNIVPYIFAPIFCVLLLISSTVFIYKMIKIFPPKDKKKLKKTKNYNKEELINVA